MKRRMRLVSDRDLGADLVPVPLVVANAATAGSTDALVLSCMDFRLMDDIERYLSATRQLTDRYDHIVLAGASLGAVSDRYPAWNKTFWEHLEIAIGLHSVHTVIIMDHRDCGAYKIILGEDYAKTTKAETSAHAMHLRKLRGQIAEKHPKLKVELLLMALDGTVESIT